MLLRGFYESYLHLTRPPLPVRVVVVSIDPVDILFLQILQTQAAAGAVAELPAHVDQAANCEETHEGDHPNEDEPANIFDDDQIKEAEPVGGGKPIWRDNLFAKSKHISFYDLVKRALAEGMGPELAGTHLRTWDIWDSC